MEQLDKLPQEIRLRDAICEMMTLQCPNLDNHRDTVHAQCYTDSAFLTTETARLQEAQTLTLRDYPTLVCLRLLGVQARLLPKIPDAVHTRLCTEAADAVARLEATKPAAPLSANDETIDGAMQSVLPLLEDGLRNVMEDVVPNVKENQIDPRDVVSVVEKAALHYRQLREPPLPEDSPTLAGQSLRTAAALAERLDTLQKDGSKPPPNPLAVRAEIRTAMDEFTAELTRLTDALNWTRRQREATVLFERSAAECSDSAQEKQRQVDAACAFTAEVAAAVDAAKAHQAARVGELAANKAALLLQLQGEYDSIAALTKELDIKKQQARSCEDAYLSAVALHAAHFRNADVVPSRLRDLQSESEKVHSKFLAELRLINAGSQTARDLVVRSEASLQAYEAQVTGRLETTHVTHWEAFRPFAWFLTRHVRNSQERALKAQQMKLAKAEDYAQWKALAQPEGSPEEAPEDWGVFERGDASWRQAMEDSRVTHAARQAEVKGWVEAREALCHRMAVSGTREYLKASEVHGGLLRCDPAQAAGRADQHLLCQAVWRHVLDVMQKTHNQFGQLYEAVMSGDDWLQEWRRLVELSSDLRSIMQKVTLPTADASAESSVATSPVSPSELISSMLNPEFKSTALTPNVDLCANLLTNPFLRNQIVDVRRQLQEDLTRYGGRVSVSMDRPYPDAPEQSLSTTWRDFLEHLSMALEAAGPSSPGVRSLAQTSDANLSFLFSRNPSDSFSDTTGASFFNAPPQAQDPSDG